MIKYPVRAEMKSGSLFAVIRDSTDRVIAGAMAPDDADEIVAKLNAPASRSRSKQQKIEEQLRASDLTAQAAGGREDIEYGHHESLPRGEHVVRLGKRRLE